MIAPDVPGAETPRLAFSTPEVTAARGTAVPTLDLRFRVEQRGAGRVQSILLTTTVTIAAARRDYAPDEQGRLVEVFGEPHRWDSTFRGLEWTRPTVVVPAFTATTTVLLRLPCSYDFDLATTKYLHAVRSGDISLDLRFSGTVFHHNSDGRLQATQLPWEHELTATLPATSWHELVERYYGPQRWLRLGADSFAELAAFKARRAHLSWDAAVDELLELARADEGAAPHG